MNFLSLYHTLLKEHDTLCLKYRESELHEETGRIGYRTKCYETVIPQDGEIFVTEDEKVGIYIVETKQKRRNSIHRSKV